MKKNLLFSLFILASCSTSTDSMTVIKGYSESIKLSHSLRGKTPIQAKKVLGEPIMEGVIEGRYRLIYPIKDMKRFYVEITYNTDADLECTVIDFFKPKKGKMYFFPKNGKIKKLTNCNKKDGAILKLQETLDKKG